MDNLELIKKYQTTRDKNVLEELIRRNDGLIGFTLKKFYANNNYQFDYDDLRQEGILGLIRAIELFNTDLNYSFSNYAIKWIYSKMSRYIHKNDRDELSLNTSYDDDEKIELIDMIEDECNEYLCTDENIYNEYLRKVLLEKLDTLEILESEVIKYKNGFYTNNIEMTITDISKLLKEDWKNCVYAERKGMTKLRKYRRELKEFLEDAVDLNKLLSSRKNEEINNKLILT